MPCRCHAQKMKTFRTPPGLIHQFPSPFAKIKNQFSTSPSFSLSLSLSSLQRLGSRSFLMAALRRCRGRGSRKSIVFSELPPPRRGTGFRARPRKKCQNEGRNQSEFCYCGRAPLGVHGSGLAVRPKALKDLDSIENQDLRQPLQSNLETTHQPPCKWVLAPMSNPRHAAPSLSPRPR